MNAQQEIELANRYGWQETKDDRRGDAWCKFRRNADYLWSTGKQWIVATLVDNHFTNHRQYDNLAAAVETEH